MEVDLVAAWEDRGPATVTVGVVSVGLSEDARAELDRAAQLTESANSSPELRHRVDRGHLWPRQLPPAHVPRRWTDHLISTLK